MESLLEVIGLSAGIDGKDILKGVSLTIQPGEVHAVMGRNGSGKSTLSHVIMGHPSYKIKSGTIFFKGKDLNSLKTDERARLGIFLSFQHPVALPGVTVFQYLKMMLKAARGKDVNLKEFRSEVRNVMSILKIDESFLGRYTNDGFSGGEKKKAEILQYALLQPDLSILDETDSGLDVDALDIVAKGVHQFRKKDSSIVLISHYHKMLTLIPPEKVHVIHDGRIVHSGFSEVAKKIEESGYDSFIKQ